MKIYITAKRVELIMLYGNHRYIARRTAAMFNEKHHEKDVDHNYVSKVVKKKLWKLCPYKIENIEKGQM